MRNFLRALLLVLGLTTLAAQAKVYQWTDENGKVHFSDIPREIEQPEQQRPSAIGRGNTRDSQSLSSSNNKAYGTSQRFDGTQRLRFDEVRFIDKRLYHCIQNSASKTGKAPVFTDELTSLTCSGLVNLTGLEHFTSLKSLILSNTVISDLSPLSGLTKLDFLSISKSYIKDVSPLSSLTELTVLILSDAQIQDVNPLAKLTKLISLDLQNNKIESVQGLYTLKNLSALSFDGNAINCQDLALLYVEIVGLDGQVEPKCGKPFSFYKRLGRQHKKEGVLKSFRAGKKSQPSTSINNQQKNINQTQINNQDKLDSEIRHLLQQQDITGLKTLLSSHNISVANYYIKGKPLLNYAVFVQLRQRTQQNFELLDWLISEGADVNGLDSDTKGVLYLIYEGGFDQKNLALLNYLIKKGVDINYAPENKASLLTTAVSATPSGNNGGIDWIKVLIELGADVNKADGRGSLALHKAYSNKFYDAFEYLLANGADINLRGANGNSLNHYIAWGLGHASSSTAKEYMAKSLKLGLQFDLNYKNDRRAYNKCLKYVPVECTHLSNTQVIKREQVTPYVDPQVRKARQIQADKGLTPQQKMEYLKGLGDQFN